MEELSHECRGNEGAILRSMAKMKPNKTPRKPLRGQRKYQLNAPSYAPGLTEIQHRPPCGAVPGPEGNVLGTVAGPAWVGGVCTAWRVFDQELPVTGEPAGDETGAGSKQAHAGPGVRGLSAGLFPAGSDRWSPKYPFGNLFEDRLSKHSRHR